MIASVGVPVWEDMEEVLLHRARPSITAPPPPSRNVTIAFPSLSVAVALLRIWLYSHPIAGYQPAVASNKKSPSTVVKPSSHALCSGVALLRSLCSSMPCAANCQHHRWTCPGPRLRSRCRMFPGHSVRLGTTLSGSQAASTKKRCFGGDQVFRWLSSKLHYSRSAIRNRHADCALTI
jgi:hypothetical protein